MCKQYLVISELFQLPSLLPFLFPLVHKKENGRNKKESGRKDERGQRGKKRKREDVAGGRPNLPAFCTLASLPVCKAAPVPIKTLSNGKCMR